MTEKSSISALQFNINEIYSRIEAAAIKSGRTKDDITLLAAVKTVSPDIINQAIKGGIKYIGDNRVQELKEKEPFITEKVHKHFIGHLQTNKVKDVITRVEMIESVDSLHLAKEISKQAVKRDINMDILLEVNIGLEESKSGFNEENLIESLKEIAALPNIKVRGLMAIPPICETAEQAKPYFLNMQKLFIDIRDKNIDNISMEVLSMGMSDTYEAAIECGANLVRVGTLLFGKRIYK